MKKKLLLIALVLICALALAACGCKHETWVDANCETPKTCAECGETEGAPLGHTWAAATCETPKTCEVCAKTEGEALGHAWVEATCEAPKTCETCKLTEGEALGHVWLDATTEAPKTCETCALTEGERIITDERFTTAATAAIQGKWAFEFDMTGEMMDLADFEDAIACVMYLELGNDGTATMSIAATDPDAFAASMTTYLVNTLYAEFAASGLDKEAADEAFLSSYGMSLEEYAGYAVEEMDVENLFASMSVKMVYYVEDGQLYMADSWDDEMGEPTPFTLEGDTLSMSMEGEDLSSIGIDGENLVLTRVVEEE